MKLGRFYDNPEIGRNSTDLTTDLREVNAETRKRVNNGLDCEDQQCRAQNLRDARGRLN